VRWLGDDGHRGKQRKANGGTYRRRNRWQMGLDKWLVAILYRRVARGHVDMAGHGDWHTALSQHHCG
jgi:hypothetical protein